MGSSLTLEEIASRIRTFIFDNYLFGYQEEEFEDDASILDMGVIDSTGILELVMFLEEEYDIAIADPEITPENLDSVNRISRYIFSKIHVD